jgi:hypothetical protein
MIGVTRVRPSELKQLLSVAAPCMYQLLKEVGMKSVSISLSAFFLVEGLCFAEGRGPHLGLDNSRLIPCPGSPNCVSSQANDPKHAIAPLIYQDSRSEAFARLRQVLTEMKRTVIITE